MRGERKDGWRAASGRRRRVEDERISLNISTKPYSQIDMGVPKTGKKASTTVLEPRCLSHY